MADLSVYLSVCVKTMSVPLSLIAAVDNPRTQKGQVHVAPPQYTPSVRPAIPNNDTLLTTPCCANTEMRPILQ